ncbi:MAG: hypothetical protein MKZ56_06645 [Candidatus Thalassarchaeum sp.]|nr:hypothetical protein [Candidatus Thalassarchaeum sp.]
MSEDAYTVAGRNMPDISIAVGLIFTIWGIGAYIISDMASITAMIPMFVGGPIFTMGLLSKARPDKRKTFMHISAMFGLLCALGGLRLPMILMADDSSNLLIGSHAILLILGGLYTYFCVQSFIWARKQREAAEA